MVAGMIVPIADAIAAEILSQKVIMKIEPSQFLNLTVLLKI